MRSREDTFFYADAKYPKRKGFCRVCGAVLTDKRRVACPGRCRETLMAWPYQWADVCRVVYDRDAGICADCGLDTAALQGILWHCSDWKARRCALVAIGYACGDTGKSLWQAHHSRPVASHGPAQSIDEIVTLCVPCHRKRHAARPKARKRLAEVQPNLPGV